MTRDMSPFQVIRKIGNEAQFLEAEWREYETTMAELMSEPAGSGGYSERTSGGNRSDPTANQMEQLETVKTEWNDVYELLLKGLDAVVQARRIVKNRSGGAAADQMARAKDSARCQCYLSIEDWADPTCTDMGVKDGLSARCYERRRVFLKDPTGYRARTARRHVDPKNHGAEIHQLSYTATDGKYNATCSCSHWTMVYADTEAQVRQGHSDHLTEMARQVGQVA